MSFRQDLEGILTKMRMKHQDAIARLQHLEGQASMSEPSKELDAKLTDARDDVIMASACEQLLIWQIREVDLEEPDYEFVKPIRKVEIE